MSDECNGGLGELYDHYEERDGALAQTIATYRQRYDKARIAKIGEEMQCTVCGARMVKRSWQHKFCHTRHKDKYWNTVDDSRRARAVAWNN